MTRPIDPLFDQRIADWLEEDPRRAPGQVLGTVLAALPSIPQRRASRVPWGFAARPSTVRWSVAAAAVIVVLGAGGAFYMTQRSQPAVVGGPSQSPASASPSAVPSASAVPAKAPSWTATGNMTTSGSDLLATLLRDGKVLVAGGGATGTDAQRYDPASGTWTRTGSMVSNGSTATLLRNGKVLVTGGHNEAGGSVASAQVYDPGNGTWSRTGDMTTSRRDFSATLLPNGKVLVAGGEEDLSNGNAVELASAELYDPDTGTWTRTGSMAATRFGHTATLLANGKVLVAGGAGMAPGATICSDPLASAELYDPASGIWTATGTMTIPRVDQTAVLLPDGRALVLGGADAGAAEVYDPGSGTWARTENMPTPRSDVSATVLHDGKVLIVGGGNQKDAQGLGVALASADLYDPGSRSWTTTASLSIPRYGHTATLLPDGEVLVAGGSDHGLPLASAELYDPGSGQ